MLRYLLLVPALLLISSTSDADSCFGDGLGYGRTMPTHSANRRCKVAVLEFDGDSARADAGHNTVVTSLLDTYDLVARKRWITAYDHASAHGPSRWQQAAARSGVDAVIEGWVVDEGRHHVLSLLVRDTSTGSEIDTVSVKVNDKGVVLDPAKMKAQLDDVLDWADCPVKIAD